MLRHTRVSKTVDVTRLARAIRAPGIDPRTWSSLAYVTAVVVDPVHGVLCNVVLLPSNVPSTARLGGVYAGSGFGAYFPVKVDDEVLVEAPSGNPDEGLVITRSLHSPSDPPPTEVVTHPGDGLVRMEPAASLRLLVSALGFIELGEPELNPVTTGALNGETIDPFSGLTFWELGFASLVVRVKGPI